MARASRLPPAAQEQEHRQRAAARQAEEQQHGIQNIPWRAAREGLATQRPWCACRLSAMAVDFDAFLPPFL